MSPDTKNQTWLVKGDPDLDAEKIFEVMAETQNGIRTLANTFFNVGEYTAALDEVLAKITSLNYMAAEARDSLVRFFEQESTDKE